MRDKLKNTLLVASNESVKYHLGISDFKNKVISYRKILYSHNILTYDSESIYFIDKLHITFCLTNVIKKEISNSFFKRESIRIGKYLILKPNYANGANYHHSFMIEIEGVHFGYLHLKNTKKTRINKIEIDNRILYEKPIIYILARLYHITKIFGLQFNNINVVEIARDSPNPLYSMLSEIYYQSTKCNSVVHEISGKKPLFKPCTKAKLHDYPDDDTKNGTFTIGSKSSETFLKIYNKTPEIANNNFKKNYINEIHEQHFGANQNISRVEVSIFTNAFRQNGVLKNFDNCLMEILNPTTHLPMFFKALGEKLTFNKLSTRVWNKSNNDKYEKIRLIPHPDPSIIKQKKIGIKPNNIRFIHNNNINKYKFKLIEYLDEDISFSELKRYFHTQNKKNELNTEDVLDAYKKVVRNYQNSLNNKRHDKVKKLLLSLTYNTSSHIFRFILSHIIAKLTFK
jgi:hypothetical protein